MWADEANLSTSSASATGTDLDEIYTGDSTIYDMGYVDPAPKEEEIDMTITETTDIHGNKAEKIDYVEFSWDSFAVTDWQFTDLIELIRDDDQAKIVAEDIRQSFMDRYKEEVANLPQVCEPGKKCRREILEILKTNISVLTTDAVDQIKEAIQRTVQKTRKHLKSAYEDAFYCDHGCECQFVEEQYSYLLAQIESHEADITAWKGEQ